MSLESSFFIILRRSGDKPDVRLRVTSNKITVLGFKDLLESENNIPARGLRLIHSGRVLNDERTLESYGICEGSVVHLVQTASNNVEPPSSSGQNGLNSNSADNQSERQFLKAIDNNPAMKRLTENPDLLRAVIMSNPQIREIVDQNPEYAHIFNDPNFLRQGFELARNPEKMKETLRNNDRAMSNLEMQPGGFNHLKKLYNNIHKRMDGSGGEDDSTEAVNNRFAKQYGVTYPEENKINSLSLPNPWAPPPSGRIPRVRNQSGNHPFGMSREGLDAVRSSLRNRLSERPPAQIGDVEQRLRSLGITSSLPSTPPSFPPPSTNPSQTQPPTDEELRIQYQSQIATLNEMGFDNLSDNLRALQVAEGDVDDAVEFLLQSNS